MSVIYMRWLEKRPETYFESLDKRLSGDLSSIYKFAEERVSEGQKVLEIGCGPGDLANRIAQKGVEVIAIDSSDKMIEFANLQKTAHASIGITGMIQATFPPTLRSLR